MNGDFTERRVGRRKSRNIYMLREMVNDYAPVYMEYDPETKQTMYRLVLERFAGDDKEHNLIYLGDRLCRWVHNCHLPRVIRTRLAMIDVIDVEWNQRYELRGRSATPYQCPDNSKFGQLGWRVTNTMYTVIVPESLINSLRGESLLGGVE
jgi:hypothetical protein